MSRALFLSILFVLLAGVASAQPISMYGGETKTIYKYNISKECDKAIVNVNSSLEIDSINGTREYNFKDCSYNESTSAYNDTWECNCTQGEFDLIITTLANAVNTYSFNISFYVEETEQTTTSSSGGTTSFTTSINPSPDNETCTPDWQCGEWGNCTPDETQSRTCTDLNDCEDDRTETKECEYEPDTVEVNDNQQEDTEPGQGDNSENNEPTQVAEQEGQQEENQNIATGAFFGDGAKTPIIGGLVILAFAVAGIAIGNYYRKNKNF